MISRRDALGAAGAVVGGALAGGTLIQGAGGASEQVAREATIQAPPWAARNVAISLGAGSHTLRLAAHTSNEAGGRACSSANLDKITTS